MSYRDFFNDIKGDLSPVYLLHGDEDFLIEQGIAELKKKRVNSMYEDFNYSVFDGEKANLDEVLDTCETMPFFDPLKVVIVEKAPYFQAKGKGMSDAQEERLIEYLNNASPSTCLVMVAGNSIDKRKKVTKAISKQGRLVEFGKLSPAEFKKWMAKVIKSNGVEIGNRAYFLKIQIPGEALATREWAEHHQKVQSSSLRIPYPTSP